MRAQQRCRAERTRSRLGREYPPRSVCRPAPRGGRALAHQPAAGGSTAPACGGRYPAVQCDRGRAPAADAAPASPANCCTKFSFRSAGQSRSGAATLERGVSQTAKVSAKSSGRIALRVPIAQVLHVVEGRLARATSVKHSIGPGSRPEQRTPECATSQPIGGVNRVPGLVAQNAHEPIDSCRPPPPASSCAPAA